MKGKIILETGEIFEGNIIHGSGTVAGKLVFDTRVVGYEKVLTSPEYAGKIVCFAYPLIGNYGVCREDTESDTIYPAGIIISEYSEIHSNFRAECSLKEFLMESTVSLIEGVDTQHITEIVREDRSAWAGIASGSVGLNSVLKQIKESRNTAPGTRSEKDGNRKYPPLKKGRRYLAVIDLGLKKSEIAMLNTAGLELALLDDDTPKACEILESAAAIYVSSGSENAVTAEKTAELIRTVAGNIPVFGTGLGHIAAGLACGGEVSPENVNHYGVNQPVTDARRGNCYITEQAHSMVLDRGSVSGIIKYVNVNDGTVEGLQDKTKKVVTTAFQPTVENFRDFLSMIKE